MTLISIIEEVKEGNTLVGTIDRIQPAKNEIVFYETENNGTYIRIGDKLHHVFKGKKLGDAKFFKGFMAPEYIKDINDLIENSSSIVIEERFYPGLGLIMKYEDKHMKKEGYKITKEITKISMLKSDKYYNLNLPSKVTELIGIYRTSNQVEVLYSKR